TDRTRWQLLATRQRGDFVACQSLSVEQGRSNGVQQLHVLLQYGGRPRIRFFDHAGDLAVNQLRGALGDFATRLQLAAQEELLLVIANKNWPDFVRQSPLRDVATGETRRLLDVAGGASGNALTAEHELLRDASAISLDEIRLELLARDRDAVVFGERPGNAKRSTTRHDGHFVQRIVALHLDRADGVPTFVIRGELPLLVLHHHRFAPGAYPDLVLPSLQVGRVA